MSREVLKPSAAFEREAARTRHLFKGQGVQGPEYQLALEQLPEQQRRQLLEGNWDLTSAYQGEVGYITTSWVPPPAIKRSSP